MASGDFLIGWEAVDGIPPASNFAPIISRNGHMAAAFDASTDETLYFSGFMPAHYSGGGVTVTLVWMAASATTGTCRWEVGFERHEDDADDLDSDSFASNQSAGTATASASGEPKYTNITFSNGAQMDNVAAGEHFRLRVTRDADGTTGTDNMAGDAQLLAVVIKET